MGEDLNKITEICKAIMDLLGKEEEIEGFIALYMTLAMKQAEFTENWVLR